MRLIAVLIFTISFGSSGIGQTFEFNDTILSVGSIHRLNQFDWSMRFAYIHEGERKLIYDSIIDFMNRHPLVMLEIGFHTDSRASEKYSMKLTEKRAENVQYELWKAGADTTRIRTVGYGETKLINDDDYILKLTSE
jgi:hypothetical protein